MKDLPWRTRKEAKAYIQELLERDAQAVERGVLAVYRNQTQDEQRAGTVERRNGMGFTPADADFLGSLAQRVEAGHGLSPRQLEYARKLVKKYWNQLRAVAEERLSLVE